MNFLNRYENLKNPWIKLALTPFIGGLFLMFLPAIGFILVGYALYKKIIGAFTEDRTQVSSLPC